MEYTSYVFSNGMDGYGAADPAAESVLQMFVEGTLNNQVGVMRSWNVKSGEEELVLIGVQLDENGKPECYPLAKVLLADEAANYFSPDGKGGWFDLSDRVEVAAQKELMADLRTPQPEALHG